MIQKITLFFLMLGALAMNVSSAANLLIWPTNLHLENKEKSAALWIENRGQTVQVLQARVYLWHHKDGKDELVPQSNFMVSPPMAKVAPGKKQLFRIVNRAGVPANSMQHYRVLIDEVPQKANVNQELEDEIHQGVQFQFRYSIPLFVYGQGLSNNARQKLSVSELVSKLSWNVVKENGKTVLKIKNSSPYYMNVSSLTPEKNLDSDIGGYLLPNSSREWDVPNTIQETLYGRINNEPEKVLIKP